MGNSDRGPRTPEQADYWEAFSRLPFAQQVEWFLRDVDHPPQFFPPWFAMRILERLRTLPRMVRLGIL